MISHSLFQLISFSLLFLHTLIVSYVSSDPWYIEVGESIVTSLNTYTKVEGGFASVKDVTTMQLEDHQHSFFLAETWEIFILLTKVTWFGVNGFSFSVTRPKNSILEMICFSLLFLRCKYLYLLFNDSFLANQNYIFTTEGHPFPVRSAWHEKLPETYALNNWTSAKVCFEILKILSKCLFDLIFEMPIKIFRILNLNNKDLLALC